MTSAFARTLTVVVGATTLTLAGCSAADPAADEPTFTPGAVIEVGVPDATAAPGDDSALSLLQQTVSR